MRELDAPYPLPAAAIDAYREQGFVRLKNVLSAATLGEFGTEITRQVRTLDAARLLRQHTQDYGSELAHIIQRNLASAATNTPSTYARAFTQKINLWRLSTTIETLVLSRRLAQIASELMGVAGVRLYHDQALFKEAHGGHTPWHVDQFYWPLSNPHTVTAWIPLQPVPLAMGPVAFAAGSHRGAADGPAGQLAISDESEEQLSRLMCEFEVFEAPFELGEVSFHSGWTCHRAGPNQTDQTRAAFTIIYMDRDIRLIEPQHRNHRGDAAMWLPGVKPGEVAASKLNPILYQDIANEGSKQ